MNCDKTISLLLELLEDEIGPKTKKGLLGHLQECPPGAHEQVDDFPTPAR